MNDVDIVWQQLFTTSFPAKPPAKANGASGSSSTAGAGPSNVQSWRERFKSKYMVEAREKRLEKKVALLKMRSTVQVRIGGFWGSHAQLLWGAVS